MKGNFLKRTRSHLKMLYWNVFPLTLSVVILFLIILALSMINEITSYISFVLLLLVFFPLLLSVQLFATKIFANKFDVDYKEVYKQFKNYYSPMFNGCYGVFTALLFTMFSIFIISLIFEYVFIYLQPELIDLIMTNPELFIEKIISYPFFNYYVVVLFGLIIFVFLYKILSCLPNPYFSCFCGVSKKYVKPFLKHLKNVKQYPYKKNMFQIGFPLALIFLIIYPILSLVVYHYLLDFNYAIFIGLSGALIACSFYLPYYFDGCYLISMEVKEEGVNFLKQEITKEYEFFINNPHLSNEEKEMIEKKYEEISKIFPSNKKEENDKKEEE